MAQNKRDHFSRIARLAAGLLDAPMAGVCLVKGDDLELAASLGADTPAIERGLAAWSRRIARDGLLVISDLRQEEVPSGLPAGSIPVFRFVAGVPLRRENGRIFGVLCVADRLPRPDPGPGGRSGLKDLAELARLGYEAAIPAGAAGAQQSRAEQELAEAQAEIERLTRTQNRFLAVANHDLRQPFQALHLFLHLLRSKLTEPAQRELAGRIEQAVRNGERMLTSVLDLTALEIGKIKPTPSRVDLVELIGRVLADVEQETEAKGLRLRAFPSSLEADTDPVLLERILRHLVANAIRMTESGSVLIGCRQRGARVAVEVWDTGPGIPDDQRQAIFEPFHQIIPAGGDRGGRLGLGLAIVERTAKLIGAEIQLCSRPGRGTMFRVLVPAANVERAEASGGGAASGPRPVVVIEDDPVQLMAVRMILEGWGLTVVAAASRERALEAVSTAGEKPGLILSDLRLRGPETGLDVVAALRDALGGTIPAILMTGDNSPEQVHATQAAGVHLLQKPFGPEHLRGVIESVTGWRLR